MTIQEPVDRPDSRRSPTEGKYLVFGLGNDEYGIEINEIREIIALMKVTDIPRTPDYVRGVMNLRGSVVPVIDLRLRLGMAEVEPTNRTCIVVVDVHTDQLTLLIGLVVDSVNEVAQIRVDQLSPPPAFGGGIRTDYITGMARTENSVKILLDIQRVLTQDTLLMLQEAI